MNQGFSPAEVTAMKKEILASLHCALPGIVESFDAEQMTAVVHPAVKNPAGVTLPTLYDVPVFMPVPFEIHPGDACLLVFADCDMDAWFRTGEAAVPDSGRLHSLSDAFAFVGFRTAAPREDS